MKADIRDIQALSRLSLLDVRAYLESQGWNSVGRYGSAATIYRKMTDAGDGELLLPMGEQFADYPQRMRDVVVALSAVENRSQLEVFHDLIKSGFDVLRVRAPQADDAGTIELEDGVTLYDRARDLVSAAANAAVRPKRAFRGPSYDSVRDYLQSLRLGQTEVGSYVLTVLSPVPPALQGRQSELFPELGVGDEPFARTVTRTLDNALHATKLAVAEATATGKLEPFELAVGAGVSANLCEAIARMAMLDQGVKISLSWSRVRPVPRNIVTHVFTPENARVLAEAAVAFKESEPQSDVVIEGIVVGLHREPENFDGRAKIRGFIEGKLRTVTVEFLYGDYKKVLDAHNAKSLVRVDGELVKKGVVTTLQNPRNLEIFDPDDAEDLLR